MNHSGGFWCSWSSRSVILDLPPGITVIWKKSLCEKCIRATYYQIMALFRISVFYETYNHTAKIKKKFKLNPKFQTEWDLLTSNMVLNTSISNQYWNTNCECSQNKKTCYISIIISVHEEVDFREWTDTVWIQKHVEFILQGNSCMCKIYSNLNKIKKISTILIIICI